jgi:hypothetical protein
MMILLRSTAISPKFKLIKKSEKVKNNFLSDLPWIDKILAGMNGYTPPLFREVNSHIHTPYSFSAFENLELAFSMCRDENISVLGINDFFVTGGYDEFLIGCLKNNIFPLFNIEFIGLMKEEQKSGIRINDPNNPGRIYFTGKGLDYPFSLVWTDKLRLNKVIKKSQDQIRSMIERLNLLISVMNPSLALSYDSVKKRFAHDLVRERHLAKALRHMAVENYNSPEEQMKFIVSLYGGKPSKTGIDKPASLENEIRSNLLKAGGTAFVEEDESSFLSLKKIIKIITKAGGIPCYPVLLDFASGKFTEFEADAEKLHTSLSDMGIGCIELIPGRNDFHILKNFAEFFDRKGFIVLMGTEHNTPDLTPLAVTARGYQPLDESLKSISWKGACVVAAHQYLRAHKRQGYILSDGKVSIDQRTGLENLGRMVIEYYLNKR